MLKTKYPIWYPFQEIGSIKFKITLDDIEELLQDRINTYQEGDFDYTKGLSETPEEYLERMTQERKSYTILKMGVANDELENGYLSKWFVEQEGDLFADRFRNLTWERKVSILDHLFPQDEFGPNWMERDRLERYLDVDLESEFGMEGEGHMIRKYTKGKYSKVTGAQYGLHKVIGIDFRYATFVVRTRRSNLYKGWIIDNMEELLSTVKKRFESLLREDLRAYAERIKTKAPGQIKRLTGHIRGVLTQLIPRDSQFDFSNFEFEGSYEDNLLLFPPCIQDLMSQMKNEGYLSHQNRFQLGLFLKHTGMGVDEQMKYWYQLAVDNINISYEQFEKNVGYIIRHLYGLEGKKTDYEMMSCGTIQSTASYYCRFQDMKLENIENIVADIIKSLPGHLQAEAFSEFRENLKPMIVQGNPSEACARNLKLSTQRRFVPKHISHPMFYLELAVTSNLNKKEDSSPSEDEGVQEVDDEEISESPISEAERSEGDEIDE